MSETREEYKTDEQGFTYREVEVRECIDCPHELASAEDHPCNVCNGLHQSTRYYNVAADPPAQAAPVDGGGQAFPCPHDEAIGGMTLRQWYAGLAMSALIQKAEGDKEFDAYLKARNIKITTWAAARAYNYADDMIAADKEGQR